MPEAHLARYVVDGVEGLDLSSIVRAYAGCGSEAYHPATRLLLLIYGYATGTFSRRKIERATYDSLAFRYIACNRHPDHDTLANFRKRFGQEFQSAFVQVLQVARENQLSRFGTVSLDGTQIHANASRHSALSYGHAQKIEAHLKAEVKNGCLWRKRRISRQYPTASVCPTRSNAERIVWRPLPRPKPRLKNGPRNGTNKHKRSTRPRGLPAPR